MKDAEANTLATKKTMPTEPPNSGPRALLIMTVSRASQGSQHNTNVIMYCAISYVSTAIIVLYNVTEEDSGVVLVL